MDINQLLSQINPIVIFSILGGIAIILLIIGIVVSITDDRRSAEIKRLGRYIEEDEQLSDKERARPLVEWLNNRVERSTIGERISKNLKFKPGEFVALMVISAILVGFFLWFIGGRTIFIGIIGAVIGSYIPIIYMKSQQTKRLQKFDLQLPDMLNLMVNGLRAGFSTMQAMEAVSKELPAPICDEFRRVIQEMQLGMTMEKALENLLARIPSDDLDLTLTAMNVQREVGGNLAELLDSISYTIRERLRIKGEIRVLTTQTMYSGKFLSLLPIFVIGILYLLNREYIMEFFQPESFPCGIIALVVSGLLIISGYFAMNKLSDIEV